jgi:hypothetical protein
LLIEIAEVEFNAHALDCGKNVKRRRSARGLAGRSLAAGDAQAAPAVTRFAASILNRGVAVNRLHC